MTAAEGPEECGEVNPQEPVLDSMGGHGDAVVEMGEHGDAGDRLTPLQITAKSKSVSKNRKRFHSFENNLIGKSNMKLKYM